MLMSILSLEICHFFNTLFSEKNWDVITHPFPSFDSGLTKPLKFSHLPTDKLIQLPSVSEKYSIVAAAPCILWQSFTMMD